ncbi:ATP-binding protein [Ligilactobacillus murinus]|nr:ATP-binding protein [Ligilactobacillus murinus]
MNFTVTSTRQTKALKVVVYGPEGIGKTTFANNFPQPVYIDTEGSTNFIDSQKLPDPTSWTMLLEELEYLKSTSGIARTVVIDTMDWAENLAKQHLMAKNNWDAIDASSYGTRYVALADEIGKLLNKLSELVELNYNVVLLAHSETKKHELPDELGAFDRYVLKLERRDASLVKEWADMILFANFKTTVITDSKTNSKKATGGQRVMYTTHKPTWDAKNRLGLADELPFDYEQIRVQLEQAMPQVAPAQQPVQQPVQAAVQPAPSQIQPQQVSPVQQEQVPLPEEPPQQEVQMTPPENLPAPEYTEEISAAIPQDVADLMRMSQLSTQDVMKLIYNAGFMPEGTPTENVPQDLWAYLVSKWDEALKFLNN